MFLSDSRFYFCYNDVTPPETATTPERTTSLSTRAQPHEPLLVGWIAGAGEERRMGQLENNDSERQGWRMTTMNRRTTPDGEDRKPTAKVRVRRPSAATSSLTNPPYR
jgi:hypothetical protein